MKKRIIAIIAACAMLVTAFAGIAAADGFTVGYNYFGPGSTALIALANNSQYAIEQLGDTALSISENFQPDALVGDIENLCNSGANAVLIWNLLPGSFVNLGDICAKYEVPFVLNDKIPDDDEVFAQVKENPYFIGAVCPANAIYGQQIAEYALDKGYKTCLISTASIGDATETPRIDAFKETFEAGGGEIVDILYSETEGDAQQRLESALLGADVDFIYGTGSTYGIAAVGALDTLGMTGEIPVLTSGLDSQALEYQEQGKIELITGDYWVAGYFSALLAEAYLRGNQFLDAEGNVPIIDDIAPFEVPASQFALFKAIFIDDTPYSPEETEAIVNGTYDEFLDAIHSYSIEERAKAKYAQGKLDASMLEEAGISVE